MGRKYIFIYGDEPPNKQKSEQETNGSSNAIFIFAIVILSIILTALVVSILFFSFFEDQTVKNISFCTIMALGGLTLFLKKLSKVSLKRQYAYLKGYFSGKKVGKFPKPKPLPFVVALLCFVIILTISFYTAVVTAITTLPKITNINDVHAESLPAESMLSEIESESTLPDNIIYYNLLEVDECDNYYFFSEKSEKQFARNLEYSVINSQTIEVVSDEELNVSKNYGEKASYAVAHFELLDKLLSDSKEQIKKGPLPKCIFDYILSLKEEMDEVYFTPDNNYEIALLYVYGAKKEILEDKNEAYQNALIYIWRSFIANYAWGGYTDEDISSIQDIYRLLLTTNKSKAEHIQFIIDSLEILKTRLE